MVKTYRKVWINSLIKVSSCSLIKASFKNLMVYESTLNSTNLFIPVTHYLFIMQNYLLNHLVLYINIKNNLIIILLLSFIW